MTHRYGWISSLLFKTNGKTHINHHLPPAAASSSSWCSLSLSFQGQVLEWPFFSRKSRRVSADVKLNEAAVLRQPWEESNPKMASRMASPPAKASSFVPLLRKNPTRIFNKEFNLPPFPLLHNSSPKTWVFFFDQHDRQAQNISSSSKNDPVFRCFFPENGVLLPFLGG